MQEEHPDKAPHDEVSQRKAIYICEMINCASDICKKCLIVVREKCQMITVMITVNPNMSGDLEENTGMDEDQVLEKRRVLILRKGTIN